MPRHQFEHERPRRRAGRAPDEVPRGAEFGPAAVLALQRSAGNAATVRALARAKVDPAADLRSPVYAGQPQLEAAFDNAPPLAKGMTGRGVAAVQQALVDAGHDLPISMSGGRPDGIFGGETDTAVREFQATNVLGSMGSSGARRWAASTSWRAATLGQAGDRATTSRRSASTSPPGCSS